MSLSVESQIEALEAMKLQETTTIRPYLADEIIKSLRWLLSLLAEKLDG